MRRIVAIVLPQIAVEIARAKRAPSAHAHATPPIGVILEPPSGSAEGGEAAPKATAVLDAVSDDARRYGVRAGQQVTEAAALLASLVVQRVTYDELDAALGRVAEVALAFGPIAAIRLRASGAGILARDEPRTPWGDAPFDTVWLDVTGAAHLVGGEEALLAELEERVVALGHRARLAIAGGPRIAQSLARYLGSRQGAGEREDARALSGLPVQALALDPETVGFLLRIGVITVGDLMALPRARVAARLGPRAGAVLALAAGHDDTPLPPFTPPREIVESASFEEGVETTDGLLFVLRGMASHAAARLGARGEACTLLEVEIPLDRSIARLRGAHPDRQDRVGFTIELPAPLASEVDLLRALRARLDRTELVAPAVGVRLRVAQIVAAPQVQLDLSRGHAADPDSLPALLAELSAEIGPDRVGLLAVEDAHRPEAASQLVPVALAHTSQKGASRRRRAQLSLPGLAAPRPDPLPPPARLLPTPIPLGRVRRGSVVSVPHLFAVEDMTPLLRLEGVEWWTRAPASRDYLRVSLSSGSSGSDAGAGASKNVRAVSTTALVYVVRRTGEMFLQGWYE